MVYDPLVFAIVIQKHGNNNECTRSTNVLLPEKPPALGGFHPCPSVLHAQPFIPAHAGEILDST
jgi:hypothetical protein